jgi:hypothetical protein
MQNYEYYVAINLQLQWLVTWIICMALNAIVSLTLPTQQCGEYDVPHTDVALICAKVSLIRYTVSTLVDGQAVFFV